MKERLEINYDAVDEIPNEYKTFTNDQIVYVNALVASVLLNDAKGQLLNIVEGIGLADKQEKAIRRLVTNVLHDTVRDIEECLELVEVDGGEV